MEVGTDFRFSVAEGPGAPPPPPPPAPLPPKAQTHGSAESLAQMLAARAATANNTSENATKSKNEAPTTDLLAAIRARKPKSTEKDEEYYEKVPQPDPKTVLGRANVLAWGHNAYGRLGTGDEISRLAPDQTKMLPPVQAGELFLFKKICIGAAHNYAIDSDGAVWTWGKCHFGQLGHGFLWMDIFYPRKIETPLPKIVSVTAGDSFGYFISEQGDVYSVGCGHFGALGLGDEKSRSKPVKVPDFPPAGRQVVSVAGGAFHGFFVLDDGSVYAQGKNVEHQCAILGKNQLLRPTLVEALRGKRIVSAACGKFFSIFLAEDGKIYSAGSNEDGLLGIGLHYSKKADEALFEVNFSLAVEPRASKNGFFCKCGRCKTDDFTVVNAATPEDGKPVAISAESLHSLVLFESGAIYTFGCWSGVWHDTTPETAAVPVRVKMPPGETGKLIACGARMSAIVSNTNKVYTYGESTYGKCGRPEFSGVPAEVDLSGFGVGTVDGIDSGSNSVVLIFTSK